MGRSARAVAVFPVRCAVSVTSPDVRWTMSSSYSSTPSAYKAATLAAAAGRLSSLREAGLAASASGYWTAVTRSAQRLEFDGWILGLGTRSGTRVVVGHWPRSPFGPMSDVMVQRPDGHRVLLAPTQEVAGFVAATYTFDEVQLVPVTVGRPDEQSWTVAAGPLRLTASTGRRTALGRLLRAVPGRLACTPAWVGLLDVPARLTTGLRTTGTAGNGRTEWYGVQDLHPVTAVEAGWAGDPLGALAPVRPPVTFGFGSVPPRPSVVRVTTTVQVP
jgi:hypothetical protein